MKQFLLGLVLVIVSATGAKSQWLMVVETFNGFVAKQEPAQLLITTPQNKPANYIYNVAIGLRFKLRDDTVASLEILPIAEWHRNDVIDKPLNTEQYGGLVAGHHQIGKGGLVLKYQASGKYSRNHISLKESGIYSAMVAPTSSISGNPVPGAVFPNAKKAFANTLQFKYVVSVGVDRIDQTDLWLSNLYGELNLYPLSGFLKKYLGQYEIFVLSASRTLRGEVAQNDSQSVNNLTKLSGAIQFTFQPGGAKGRSIKLAVGVDRISGEDPTISLQTQEYTQATFKFLLAL